MKNFTFNENVQPSEFASKPVAKVESPKESSINTILAYSKSLKMEKSKLLNQEVKMNLN